ncbi:hypothetical protein B0T22DRAFT_6920 [Podospora appendiculata]|uniref:Uncharacterized protein n=1 Tax=Podospora appendiculata TaxID=314037 RepID=A0AAE1CF86_9PEZI|nr:hypothetical protein B0T22DRAFT_6920 [Podospora appendiculata]
MTMTRRATRAAASAGPALPMEIWWLCTQELANRRDFASLFQCARVSRGLAALALPMLYGIHELSPSYNDIIDLEASVGLWRSIISSSFGKTLLPYCSYIKTLRLGNLHQLLEDLARGSAAELRNSFFSAPLQEFRIRRARGKLFDLDAIVLEVANKITDCLRIQAEQQGKSSALASLEGLHLPSVSLQGWIPSLSRLTTLTVRDGSVLTRDVGKVIRENCPSFKEVGCYWCRGTDVDPELAGFFRELAPNTLESFTIQSLNNIGPETFKALSGHAVSLKCLGLFSLQRPAFESLNLLGGCRRLEALTLESAMESLRFDWKQGFEQQFTEVLDWLQHCTYAKDLRFLRVASASKMLGEVLKTPGIQPLSISIRANEFDDSFYTGLLHQPTLRRLTVRIVDDDVLESNELRRVMFVASLCLCRELRELETNEKLTVEDLTTISKSCTELEEIELSYDVIDDLFLYPLARLSRLKSLSVFGNSSFTFHGISDFLGQLEAHPDGQHNGLHISIMSQDFHRQLSPSQESFLTERIQASFDGKFDVVYGSDPNELHTSDFSD